MKSIYTIILLILLIGQFSYAQESRRILFVAAQEAAHDELLRAVQTLKVTNDMDMQAVLDHVSGDAVRDQLISSALQIGKERWLDDQTCQVKYQVTANSAGKQLKKMIDAHGPTSFDRPIDNLLTSDWKTLTIDATGTSLPANQIVTVAPEPIPEIWRGIRETDRINLAKLAYHNAQQTMIQWVCERYKCNPDQAQKLNNWAATMPATRLTFGENGQVEIVLFMDQESLLTQLKMILKDSGNDELLASLQKMPRLISGHSELAAQTPPVVARAKPATAPIWIRDALAADGVAKHPAGKLQSARAAETAGREALLKVIMALQIDPQTTISQAANKNPAIGKAVDRVLNKARISNIEYRTEGSVKVTVTIDAAELWDELSAAN